MGKQNRHPVPAPKRMESEPAFLIERLPPDKAEWKVFCVRCKEWYRRIVQGVSDAHMWRIIQSRDQVCPTSRVNPALYSTRTKGSRVKTQGSLPSEESAILLLFGLIVSQQIRFRKIDGWEKIVEVVKADGEQQRRAS